MTDITPDIFRRAVVVSLDTDEDGCSTAEVALDGLMDEDTATVELPPTTAKEQRILLYTIGDITDDSPLHLFFPGILHGRLTNMRATGQGTDADGAEIGLRKNGTEIATAIVGDGWVDGFGLHDDSLKVVANDDIAFVVNDDGGGSGSVLCYLKVQPYSAALLEVGDKIHVQKEAHRQGGHGRWRKVN